MPTRGYYRRVTRRYPLPAPPVGVTFALALVLNLCLLPTIFHPFDLFTYWIAWASGSHGTSPWLIYRDRPTCDYPAVWPYLLTILERVRLSFGWSADDMLTVYLFKLPGMVAHLIGIPLVYKGLRRVVPGNGRVARRAALLYALCPALLVNGVLWGQIDTILCLGMVGATLALMNRRPIHAGVWFGFALSVKLQAIIIAPALLLYAVRTLRPRGLAAGAGAALAVVTALAAPYIVAGTGRRWVGTYVTSVGRYPNRTVSAASIWMLVTVADARATGKRFPDVNHDTGRILRGVPVTERMLGIALFVGAMAAILALLWRRAVASPFVLPLAASASVWAFYLLCTQMHERYGVPAAALLTLCVGLTASASGTVRWAGVPIPLVLWCAVALSSAWNQFLVLNYDYRNVLHLPQTLHLLIWDPSMAVLPFANMGLIALLLWRLRQVPPTQLATVRPPV